jgi:hypothetical protein
MPEDRDHPPARERRGDQMSTQEVNWFAAFMIVEALYQTYVISG